MSYRPLRLPSGCLLCLWSGALALSGGANAEALTEISITAVRQGAANIQDVPAAVSALVAKELRDAQITDLAGIAERTPGLTVSSFNVGQATPFIRGIGSTEDGAGGDSSVGVFLDEVYLGRTAGLAADLFGLERVEVLRGPQGTLYGRNVVGGAINLVTAKPDQQTIRQVEATYGNLDGAGGFVLSGPVGESGAAASLAGTARQRDGYLESVTTGEEQLDQDRRGMRGELVFFPDGLTEIRLSADYSALDESGPNRHVFGYLDRTIIAPLDPRASEDYHRNYDIDPGKSDGKYRGLSARIERDIGALTLTSITAFRDSDLYVNDASIFDLDALMRSPGFIPYVTAITNGYNIYDEQARQFSQELRLGGGGRDTLGWLGGLYYYGESVDRVESFDFDAALAPGVMYEGGKGISDQRNTTDSYAIFGQLTYPFSERWDATAGARYTWDRKRIEQTGKRGGFLILEDYAVTGDERWGQLTPKLGLDYRPDDSTLWYGSYSQGYKSGGFQGQAPTKYSAATPYDPELADSYEVGLKWEGSERRLRFSASAFYMDYRNLQVQELVSPANAPAGDVGVMMTFNAADAVSQGIELEWSAIPAERWTLSGSYAWLDATYTDFRLPGDLGFRFTNPVDRTGNRLRNAPEHSANLRLSYAYPLAGGGELDTGIEYIYQSKYYQDPANREWAAVPAYDLINLRSAWRPSDRLEIAAWIHNLLDEDYLIHNSAIGATGLGTPGLPRTFGVTVRYDFGK